MLAKRKGVVARKGPVMEAWSEGAAPDEQKSGGIARSTVRRDEPGATSREAVHICIPKALAVDPEGVQTGEGHQTYPGGSAFGVDEQGGDLVEQFEEPRPERRESLAEGCNRPSVARRGATFRARQSSPSKADGRDANRERG